MCFRPRVAQHNVPNLPMQASTPSSRRFVPGCKTQEDGDRDAVDADPGDGDVFQGPAVDDLEGDPGQAPLRPVGLLGLARRVNGAVLDRDLLEPAARLGAHLDRVAVAADRAVAYDHAPARVAGKALQHDGVVVRIHAAILDKHVAATVHVQAVVVEGHVVEQVDLADRQPVAVAAVKHPATGVTQANPFDLHVATTQEIQVLGAQLRLVTEGLALAVDRALAANGHVLEVRAGQDGRVAECGLLGGRAGRGSRPSVILVLAAAQERATLVENQGHVALQVDCAGEPGAGG